ncbi:histone-fold-containing protein [Artomyces pyxidatus]|uniref:Histone-fold-containing protein n=1 Tax=Artomyces pyxidatus TaxID=48021 RepID=A0ACB8T896_9AGAM|nr:histone-fold-containing protein [Artomyces pyxidatus]
MPRKDNSNGPATAQAQQDAVSEGIENFELPRALVTKIAKSAIPENTKLQKDTVLSLVKGSTVFINYLAATAHDVSTSKQHKSISASDVLKALELMEFSDLVGPLQAELQIYRDNLKGKKGSGLHLATPSASAPPLGVPTTTSAPNPPRSKTVGRPKGKERAVDDSVSAPLPAGAEGTLPNGFHNGPSDDLDVDEEMREAVDGDETEEGEGEEPEGIEEEIEEEQDGGEEEEEEEPGEEEPAEGDVEMGVAQLQADPDDDADED